MFDTHGVVCYVIPMTTTAAKATIKSIGQSLYLVSTDHKGNQRVEFIGGEGDRSYGEKLMAWRNR